MSQTKSSILRLLFTIVFLPICAACQPTQASDHTLMYGLTLSPSGIDPHINASAELGIPLRSVYDTLVYLDPQTGEFVPGLATSWEISSDGMAYTFELRSGVSFHDGTDFDAAAVQANIEYVLNPDHHSQKAAALLGPIDNVEVIDDDTVTIYLQEPFAPLLDSLSQVYLGMASPQALERWGPSNYQFHQVGTGPFRFIEYVPDDHILLERNDDYDWSPDIYRSSLAAYSQVEFRFFEDTATRAIALESGNVDLVGEIPPIDAARLSQEAEFTLHPVPIPGQPLQYLFNTSNQPTDDVRVRTALIHAVDRQMIVRTVFGETSPVARGPLSQEMFSDLLASDIPDYDIESAFQSLQDAGWNSDDSGILRNPSGKTLELKIVAPSWGSNPAVAQLLKVAWENLGAVVTLEIAPGFGPLKEIQSSGDYHVIGINFFGTDPDLLRPMFSSEGLYNWSGYANNELDRLLRDAAQATLDAQLRQSLYREAITHIDSQSIVLPIRDYVNLVVTNSALSELRYTASGWFPILIDIKPGS
jgi:peptide/nickel transport system substrate-binding protein